MSYDIQELRQRIGHLPKGLLVHIERVVEISVELAHRFHVDPEKAEVAALLHDIARANKGEKLLSLAREFDLPITPLEERLPVFLHGPVGAEIARRALRVQDEEVLEAIRYHTTGGQGMGVTARVVYLADKIEPSKDARYPFNPRVRELAAMDLDEAMLEFIRSELSAHISRGDFVHPSTIEARNDLLAKIRPAK